ncbi:MAG: lipopolysaccharide assembly protein LapA domain-containing protein [Steroidobacteraceae bacterium]
MGRKKFLLLLFVVMALGMVLVALNSQTVVIELALVSWRLPLGLALVMAVAVGLIAGVMMRVAWVAELLSERGRLRRALKAAEARARTLAAGSERSRDNPL